jgi:hypothetical protein
MSYIVTIVEILLKHTKIHFAFESCFIKTQFIEAKLGFRGIWRFLHANFVSLYVVTT